MRLGIRQKIIIPAFLMMIIALGFVTVYSFILQKRAVDDLMNMTATEKFKELETSLSRSEESVGILSSTLNKNFIRITKGIAATIAADPGVLSPERMAELARAIGVDEIHVTDEDGVLRWGNIPDFYGFDFRTSEQTRPFLPALKSDNFALAQEPQQRGSDKALFQYISVSRTDKPGIVQVGVQPKELQTLIETSSIENTVSGIQLSHSGYSILIDPEGIVQAHTNPKMVGTDLSNTDTISLFRTGVDGAQRSGDYFVAYRSDNGWTYGVVYPVTEFTGSLRTYIINICIAAVVLLLLSTVFFIVMLSRIIKPLKLGVDFANEIADGHLDAHLDVKTSDETGILAESLRNMLGNLNTVIDEVREVSEQINLQSSEVSNSTDQLSSGASEQAASAEEVSASMEEMAASIKHNAENAQQTELIARKVTAKADESGQAVGAAIEAMEKIADRITVVEEIARNTNLLSLNASIEAARAGEHGKGFAVVATEVGKLAQNSQNAAREIVELSNHSMNVAREAGNTLEELIPEIKKTAELVQEISASSSEQENGVEQINTAIIQLDSVIQTNASSSEELAATASQLQNMAEKLNDTLSQFRTGSETAAMWDFSESQDEVKLLN